MRASVKLLNGVSFEGKADSGHTVVMDGPPEFGGENRGTRPMEMLLLGLGGCTAFDVVHFLRKMRERIVDCCVELDSDRADSEPKVFIRIHIHFVISGHQLREASVQRAISLSADKYCSASIMLGQTATITHDYEILQLS